MLISVCRQLRWWWWGDDTLADPCPLNLKAGVTIIALVFCLRVSAFCENVTLVITSELSMATHSVVTPLTQPRVPVPSTQPSISL